MPPPATPTLADIWANQGLPAVHQVLTNIGASTPAILPWAAVGTVLATPEILNPLVASIASGNPLAIAGTLLGTAITGYSTFTRTQLKGLTDAQLKTYTDNLSVADLNAGLHNYASNISSPTNTRTQQSAWVSGGPTSSK